MKTDINVVHISQAAKLYPRPEYIFVIEDVDARVVIKNLPNYKTLNVNRVSTEHIYQMFMSHLTELKDVYESLIDEESKKVFCGYWLGNISNQFIELRHSNTPHYILEGFIPKDGGIVIDCGTCDGHTSARFADLGYKVYGFEMDSENFKLAKKLAEEKNFIVENFGLGSYPHTMRYTHQPNNIGASSLNFNGSETAEIITLDYYVLKNRLPSVDFIKMDVEGSELDVLRGAALSIAKFKPILALSAYHKWDDLWVLMNFVKSIRSDYEFALSQYAWTRDDEGFMFRDGYEDFLNSLGLTPDEGHYHECVLFAR